MRQTAKVAETTARPRRALTRRATRRARAVLHLLLPALVVGATLLLLGRAEYVKHRFGGLAGFADIGSPFGIRAGVPQIIVNLGGYDGRSALTGELFCLNCADGDTPL